NFLNGLEHSHGGVNDLLSRLGPSSLLAGRDHQAWQVLAEELESVKTGVAGFAAFRKLASEIAAIRTIDRASGGAFLEAARYRACASAPGVPRVRIISPHALGSRYYKWIFASGFSDGEFPSRSSTNPLLTDSLVDAINMRIRPRRLMTSRDRQRREPLYL